jgi:hypothetical protein
MSNLYDPWFFLWCALGLAALYWVFYTNRGHFVARVVMGVMAPSLFLLIFIEYFMDLLGSGWWAIITASTIYIGIAFIYWFSRKYGKPPQKQ